MPLRTRLRKSLLFTPVLFLPFLLIGCPEPAPNPPAETGLLKVVLATGGEDVAKDTAPKGLAPVEAGEVLSLTVTVNKVSLTPESGGSPVTVFTGPVEVDLVELTYFSRLLSQARVADGGYSNVRLEISDAVVTLSSAPNEPMTLPLPDNGVFTIPFLFDVLPDSAGIIALEMGGLGLFQDVDDSIAFQPAPAVSLHQTVANVRIEGPIQALSAAQQSFELNARSTNYSVDFNGSDIYLAGDLLEPTGAPGDLANGLVVAVTGPLGVGADLLPVRVEVLDDPATAVNEAGDRIIVCHFGGETATASTIDVARVTLEAHLDHGDFVGSCDGGDPFTLTYEAGAGGTLSGETVQMVVPGGQGEPVTAVADDGFGFDAWSDGRTDNPRTDSDVGADITVTANFREQFTLSYAAGEGGTLSGATTQAVLAGADGTAVTAVRDAGFVFVGWSDGSTENPRTDRDVTADVTVTANFSSVHTLRYTASAGGTLDGTAVQSISPGGNGTAITAIANEGFEFVGWSDGVTDNPRIDTAVSGDITVEAMFLKRFQLTYEAGANGTLSGETTQTVLDGGSGMAVTAVPAEGFGFVMWSDGSVQNPRTDTDVSGDVAVTASFATAITLSYTAGANGSLTGDVMQVIGVGGTGSAVTPVADEGFGFTGWSDGRLDNPRVDADVMEDVAVTANFGTSFNLVYTAGPGGTINGDANQTVDIHEAGTSVAAMADAGFVFRRWSDGRTDNPRLDSDVSATVHVTAEFIHQYAVIYEAGENGTIQGAARQFVLQGNGSASVTAVANDGFSFLEWSDGRRENPRTDTNVQTDITVTAIFVEGIVLNYVAGLNGSISGETSQLIQSGGSGTPVTAVPDEGFLFLEWSDGSTDNPRTDTNVVEGRTLAAIFYKRTELFPIPTRKPTP